MKKAFSIVELLVVTGIIAVLSSVLFPLFKPAALGGQEGATIKHMREIAVATAMYAVDYNGRNPLAAVLRPNPNGTSGPIGTALAYPFPYNDWPQGGIPTSNSTVWGTPAREHMASCEVDNSLTAYGGRYVLHEVGGAQYGDLFNVFYPSAPDTFGGPGGPANSGISFNGDLHQLPMASIPEPSRCVEWWCGNGNFGWHGRTWVTPSLNCGESTGPDTCMFTPGASPNQGHYSPNVPDSAYGEEIVQSFAPYLPQSYWIYPSHKAPFAYVDGDVRMLDMGTVIYPAVSSGKTPWLDPLGSVYGGKSNPFGAPVQLGALTAHPPYCNDPNTLETGGNFTGDYSCYFRPDRVK